MEITPNFLFLLRAKKNDEIGRRQSSRGFVSLNVAGALVQGTNAALS